MYAFLCNVVNLKSCNWDSLILFNYARVCIINLKFCIGVLNFVIYNQFNVVNVTSCIWGSLIVLYITGVYCGRVRV